MRNYIIVSVASGILFAVLDGIINANPMAQRLLQVYTPIAKKSLNVIPGLVIDLLYGFILAGVYLILYQSLPGGMNLIKGISFALLAWFFRVVMSVASQWMMYTIPIKTLLYTLFAGLGEMLVLGVLYGLTLEPTF